MAQGGTNPETGKTNTFGERFLHGVAAAGEGYDRWEEQQQQITAGGKAADAFRKFLGDNAASVTGIPDAAWDNMSPHQKMASMGAQIQAEAMQSSMARLKAFQDEMAEKNAEAGGVARWAQSMDDQLNVPTALANNDTYALQQQFNPAERANLHALAQIGNTNPRAAAALINNPFFRSMATGSNGSAPAPVLTMLGDQQIPVIYSPKGGQFEIDPSYRLNAAADIKSANTPAEEDPGEGPRMSKNGKFYYDTHLKSWKPMAAGPEAVLQQLFGGNGAGDVAPAGNAAPVASAAGNYPTATNKKTGEKMIYKDGKWQPAQ